MKACKTFYIYINQGPGNRVGAGSWACSTHGDDEDTFQFPFQPVESRSEELRSVAREWAAELADGDTEKAEQLWQELHKLGAKLFIDLFGESQDVIRRSLSEASGECRVVVKQFGCLDLLVPWGFLCDPSELAWANGGLNTQGEPCFWGVRYNLTINTTMSQIHRGASDWSFFSLLHESRFTPVMDLLDGAEKTLAEGVQQTAVDERRFEQLAPSDEGQQHNCFIYVYAEGYQGNLLFVREGQKTKIEPFYLLKRLVCKQGRAVLFLDACNMFEALDALGNRLQVALESREVAVVITEFQVNDMFAMRFGLELIDRCLQRDESLNEAMSAMRRNHYPMSIVFAVYTKRDVKVGPKQILDEYQKHVYRNAIDRVNFSNGLRGSNLNTMGTA